MSLLGVYITNVYICAPKTFIRVFIGVLFIIAPNWKILKYPIVQSMNKLLICSYTEITYGSEN